MKIENKNGMVFITADEGMFLTNGTLNAIALVLGNTDTPANYTERPISEFPAEPEQPLTDEEMELYERLRARVEASLGNGENSEE